MSRGRSEALRAMILLAPVLAVVHTEPPRVLWMPEAVLGDYLRVTEPIWLRRLRHGGSTSCSGRRYGVAIIRSLDEVCLRVATGTLPPR
jgi:hypothetical protein